jgi:hypothetical protein
VEQEQQVSKVRLKRFRDLLEQNQALEEMKKANYFNQGRATVY